MKHELVLDWMAKDVITVSPAATLKEAEHLLIDNTVRRLPVMEDDRLVGIVTYGDIRAARPSPAQRLAPAAIDALAEKLTVAEFMTPNPITIAFDESIGVAARLMLKNMISGLPVVNRQGELLGIITEADILRLVIHEWSREIASAG